MGGAKRSYAIFDVVVSHLDVLRIFPIALSREGRLFRGWRKVCRVGETDGKSRVSA